MLAGDFFYINALEELEGEINAVLEINAGHKIFDGHFPGQPVVPGVCMMQMVKEILESALERSARLKSADNLKFLVVINPVENKIIKAVLKYIIGDEKQVKVAASLSHDTITYFKMNAVFVFEEDHE